jgi:homocysteine S-methyltransferase
MTTFLERLKDRPLLLDGAMGTQLHARGISFDEPFDLLNLSRPNLVAEIHHDYAVAGADIIETNTFGANRFRISQTGHSADIVTVNRAAVKIARDAIKRAGTQALVAGSVGPLGVSLAPLGPVKAEEAYEAFLEQMSALAEAGIDLFVIETMYDIAEIEQAYRAARAVGKVPVVASMTFGRDNRTWTGHSPADVALRLYELGADAVGANCSTGPQRMLDVIEHMLLAYQAKLPAGVKKPYLIAMPNAGFPEQRGNRLMYPASYSYFGDYAERFVKAGCSLVGGCCGTTPEHITAMRKALDHLGVDEGTQAQKVIEVGITNADAKGALKQTTVVAQMPTKLARTFERQHFVVTVEIEPPKGYDTHEIEHVARKLKDIGATVLDIADAPMARMRMNGMVLASRIQDHVGIETILHFPVRGRNLLRVQSDLLGAHGLDIRNLFVTMGDPNRIGDYPEANDHHDIVPTGLVQLIKEKFNRGQESSGASIGLPCSFFTGVAMNLTPPDDEAMQKEAKLLKKKIDSGANFALTQPIFDTQRVRKFLDYYEQNYGKLTLPIIGGVLPLASVSHAEFFRNEVPGVVMSDDIVQRLHRVGSKTRTEGRLIAQEIITNLRNDDLIQGVYIIPAFGRFDVVERLIESLL